VQHNSLSESYTASYQEILVSRKRASSARLWHRTLTTLSSKNLIRWGGLAAVLAGVLQAVASLWPSAEPTVTLELYYLLVDLLILFGILGVYGFLGERSGVTGFLGFLFGVVGTAIIVGPDGELGGVDMYAVGSAVLAVGLVLLAVGSWKARMLPYWVPVLWVLTAVLGFVGAGVEGLASLFVVSGVTFGLSFVGAGVRVWSEAGSTAQHQHGPSG
jgi:drug/metabolite transporter (DMT)-like permease